MFVVMKKNASQEELENVVGIISNENGLTAKVQPGVGRDGITVIGVINKTTLGEKISSQPGVEEVKMISKPYKLASLEAKNGNKIVVERRINGKVVSVPFDGSQTVMIAGPCAIESGSQINIAAEHLSKLGVKLLRGGAFKPRSSPYSFQGLGEEGLKMARIAADKNNMLLVTEVLTVSDAAIVGEYADIIQIGTRNMQNFVLLNAVGELNKPVLLKRGFSATVEEFLMAAEYVLSKQPKPQVILCLRGIRTFEDITRFTFDLGTLPVLKSLTWLPVIVDPSHAMGMREFVEPVCRMAIPSDSIGFIIETHPDPANAQVDGRQSLSLEDFSALYHGLKDLSMKLGKELN